MNSEPELIAGDLVDEREAAAILAAQVKTLRNWRATGHGPAFHKVGARMIRYERATLTAFVRADGAPARKSKA